MRRSFVRPEPSPNESRSERVTERLVIAASAGDGTPRRARTLLRFPLRQGAVRGLLVLTAIATLLISACRFNFAVTFDADEHGNSRDAASTVERPTTDGTLGSGDVDYFRVQVDRLSYLEVSTTGATDTAGVLEDRAGRTVAADDDSGSGANFAIGHRLSPGAYYVRVAAGKTGSRDDTGSYTLVVRIVAVGEHGARRTTATYVPPDSRTRGYLRAGDTDYFKTVVEEEGVLRVFSTGSTDTAAILEDTAGRILDADDDGGRGTNFHFLKWVRPGTYYVRVQGYYERVGGYRIIAEGEYHLHVES